MKRRLSFLICLLTALSILLTGCAYLEDIAGIFGGGNTEPPSVSLDSIPEFDGETPYVIINDNNPFFEDESTDASYESFGEL